MAKSSPIKTVFTMAQIAGAIASSGTPQSQSPITQAGNYQKSQIPQIVAQVNTGRRSTPISGSK